MRQPGFELRWWLAGVGLGPSGGPSGGPGRSLTSSLRTQRRGQMDIRLCRVRLARHVPASSPGKPAFALISSRSLPLASAVETISTLEVPLWESVSGMLPNTP